MPRLPQIDQCTDWCQSTQEYRRSIWECVWGTSGGAPGGASGGSAGGVGGVGYVGGDVRNVRKPRVAAMALRGVLASALATYWQRNQLAMQANLRRNWIVAPGILERMEGVLVATTMLAYNITICDDRLNFHGKTTALSEDVCLGYLGNLDGSMCGISYRLYFTTCDDHMKTSSLSQSAVKGSHKASQRTIQQPSELRKTKEFRAAGVVGLEERCLAKARTSGAPLDRMGSSHSQAGTGSRNIDTLRLRLRIQRDV